MSNIVAIVGRPNVGKSTLFNRLSGTKAAIIHESSGVTRDRNYGQSEWNGKPFSIIDTGGYVINSEDVFEEEIRKQVLLAIDEADVIIFLVDVMTGVTDMDSEVASILRKSKKDVILAVNKVDTHQLSNDSHEFYQFGLGDFYCISSVNGSGTGDLLDAVVSKFKDKNNDDLNLDIPKFTVVGRPNVGKSSFINILIGEDRNIVTPIAGTTRDSLHTRYQKYGHDFIIVDTAGLRKKGKVEEDVEFYSVMRSVRAIEYSDICFLILDATRGIESQDVNIFRLIERNQKGIVVLVNKWDLVEKDNKSTDNFTKLIKEKFAPFQDLTILFISCLTKQRVLKALDEAVAVHKNRIQRIPTSKLNEIMLAAVEHYPPPAIKGKLIRIKFTMQLPKHSPAFVFFCNLPQYVKEPYKRYLENRLRENFNFTGVPIQIFIRQK